MKKQANCGTSPLDGTNCNSRDVDTTSETDNKAQRTTLEQIVKHEAAPDAEATPDGFVEDICRHETHCRCGRADCEYGSDFLAGETDENVSDVISKDFDNPAYLQDDFPLDVDTTATETAQGEAHSEAWAEEWADDYETSDGARDGIRRSYPSEVARGAFMEADEEYEAGTYAVHIGDKPLGETYPRGAVMGDGSIAADDAFEQAADKFDDDEIAPHPTHGCDSGACEINYGDENAAFASEEEFADNEAFNDETGFTDIAEFADEAEFSGEADSDGSRFADQPGYDGADAEFASEEGYPEAPAFAESVERPYTDTCEYCMISPDPETLGEDDNNIAVTMRS